MSVREGVREESMEAMTSSSANAVTDREHELAGEMSFSFCYIS